MNDIDMDHLETWIGRTESRNDIITTSLIDRFRATFSDHLWSTDDAAPLGIHWCLAPVTVARDGLGNDGHPAKDGFLPPVPLPSRMWVGGELRFHSHLKVGDNVIRNSRISEIRLKSGKSGPLVFVAIEHEYSVGDRLAISDRQDLVYKQSVTKNSVSQPMDKNNQPVSGFMNVDEVTLFRYSALTFNGHRIHYDRDYARKEEGYSGLVVHGPLQATLLMNFAAHQCKGLPARFSYRGIAPLMDHSQFRLQITNSSNGGDVWCEELTGDVTMKSNYYKA